MLTEQDRDLVECRREKECGSGSGRNAGTKWEKANTTPLSDSREWGTHVLALTDLVALYQEHCFIDDSALLTFVSTERRNSGAFKLMPVTARTL